LVLHNYKTLNRTYVLGYKYYIKTANTSYPLMSSIDWGSSKSAITG